MEDTIRLKFKYPKINSDYFKDEIYSSGRYLWTNNDWRKEEKQQGLYIPKYWIEQDYINTDKTYFCIEASLPKLIYGENHSVLYEYQFDEVVKAIREFSLSIGVYIFPYQIKSAVPTLLAIGKNINIEKKISLLVHRLHKKVEHKEDIYQFFLVHQIIQIKNN